MKLNLGWCYRWFILCAFSVASNGAWADQFTLPPMLTLGQVLTGGQQYKWENARCVQWGDSLEQGQAKGRNLWAMRCYRDRSNEIFRLVERHPEQALALTDETIRISSYLYLIRHIDEANDGLSGPKRYATFGMWDSERNQPDNPDRWMAPYELNGPCGFPRPEFALIAFCVEGCFASGQTVRFGDEQVSIEHASAMNLAHVSAVSTGSTLNELSWSEAPVSGYVETLGRGQQEIIRIETEADHVLSVTPNHPVLTGSGTLLEAKDLRVGDLLVADTGQLVAVTRLATESYFGKVYNLLIDSADPIRHLVSAGGLVNGSSYFQNEGQEWLNRLLVRINLQLE
jgi:hypothetical protein